jgi:hypothetical protein
MRLIKFKFKETMMNDQELKDLVASLAVAQAKTDEAMKKTDAKFANMLEMLTGITTSQGLVSEEFFYNCLADSLTVAGIKYDTIDKNIKQKVNGKWLEIDLLLENGSNIALIEVKYRARTQNIEQLKNTVATYREAFPQHKDYKIYAGIASFNLDDFVVNQAHEHGFFVLKRTGELLEIDSQGMRAF